MWSRYSAPSVEHAPVWRIVNRKFLLLAFEQLLMYPPTQQAAVGHWTRPAHILPGPLAAKWGCLATTCQISYWEQLRCLRNQAPYPLQYSLWTISCSNHWSAASSTASPSRASDLGWSANRDTVTRSKAYSISIPGSRLTPPIRYPFLKPSQSPGCFLPLSRRRAASESSE